jgi:hypothetical protein
MAMSGMVDLALTPDTVKQEIAERSAACTVTPSPSLPKYPYGCCLSLEDDTLEKLGLDGDLPSVGEMIQFTAIAKVTCASENEREKSDGTTDKCRRIELQITHMNVLGTDPQQQAAEAADKRRKRAFPSMVLDTDGDGE